MYPRSSIYVFAIFVLISLFCPKVIESAESITHHENHDDTVERNPRKSLSTNINENKNTLIDREDFQRHKRHRIKPKANGSKGKPVMRIVLEKLYAAHILRDNAIFVMGYILQLPEGQISVEYYSSLQIIYHALKQRRIYTYNLLSSMQKVIKKSNGEKFRQLLIALMKDLPKYMQCSAKFWIEGIDAGVIDINGILSSKQENLDLFVGISEETIKVFSIENSNDELKSYDENSRITEELMGPVYVKLFEQIVVGKIKLSQQLFGMILMDLPNADVDPVFEEYIRYIAERAWRNKIPNWNNHGKHPTCMNPYALLVNLADRICGDGKVSLKMKKALLYIRDYLSSSGTQVVHTTTHEANLITREGLNIDLLFSLLVPQRDNDGYSKLTAHLMNYLKIEEHIRSILIGMNRFAYSSPRELMLAFLARLQVRLPAREVEIQRSVSALLANLLIKTGTWDVSSPLKGAISLWVIIDVINEPNADPRIPSMITYILNELMANLEIWDSLQEHLVPDRTKCMNSKDCVLIILEKLTTVLPKDKVKQKLIYTIVNLISIVREGNMEYENDEICSSNQSESIAKPHPISQPHKPKDNGMTEPIKPPKNKPQPIVQPQRQKKNKTIQIIELLKDEPLENESTINDGKAILLPVYGIEEADEESIEEDEATSTSASDFTMPLPPKTPILPPTIVPTKCIIVVIPERGLPTIETIRPGVDQHAQGAVILPSVVDLQEKPNPDKFMLPCGKQFDRQIMKPLMDIFGEQFMQKILGDGWVSQYPTKVSLIIALLRTALGNSKVQRNSKLVVYIEKTLRAVQFATPYLFLPLLSHWKDFDVPVVWSTFGTHDQTLVIIGRRPPGDYEVGTVTIPLVNPKSWLLPVGSGDPFPTLLPQLSKGDSYEVELRPLVAIFNLQKISELLGEEIRPSLYPSRGALFVFTLQRLLTVEKIQKDMTLLMIIKNYLMAIERPAAFIKISQNYISRELSDQRGSWTVDLLGLLKALPTPNSKAEMTVWSNMRDFLSKINLLDELEIPLPTEKTTRAKFLSDIIRTALKTKKVILDDRIKAALHYYRDKVDATEDGAMYVGWIWIQKFTVKTEFHLGEMIENLVPYDDLSDHKKVAYSELVTFLARNPHLLNDHRHFRMSKHKSMNLVLLGILRHLLKKSNVPAETKRNISLLLPHLKSNRSRMRKIQYSRTKMIN